MTTTWRNIYREFSEKAPESSYRFFAVTFAYTRVGPSEERPAASSLCGQRVNTTQRLNTLTETATGGLQYKL